MESQHLSTGLVEPEPDAAELRRLDPRVIRYWRIVLLVTGLGVTAAAIGAIVFADLLLAGGAALVVIAGGIAGIFVAWIPAHYRAWAYRVGPESLRLRYGLFWRTESAVPHARIQHVDTRHNPVERRLGLARIVVHTAGSRGASLTIPGLAAADAESLRDRLAHLSGLDEGV